MKTAPSTALAPVTAPLAPPVALAELVADSAVGLIRVALEKNVSVEGIRELVQLHELMEKRDARKQFAAALRAFQQECPPVTYNREVSYAAGKGSTVNYAYAELPHIVRTIAPLLAKHGLSFRWDTTADATLLTCVCTVTHDAGHSETSSFTLPIANASSMSPQQKVGAAATYAQRRTLSSALGITTDDDDNDAAEVDPTPITDDQATYLRDLLSESQADEKRFLKWMGVADLAQIKASDYKRAANALVSKAEERASAAGVVRS